MASAQPAAFRVQRRSTARLGAVAHRNGWALVSSSAITSVLGLAYWWLAARMWPDAAVGQAAALISTMALVAELSTLGLSSGLIKHLPAAAGRSGRLTRRAFAVGAICSLVASTVVVTVMRRWIDDLDGLAPGWVPWVVIATAAWTLFTMQDGALIGFGRATFIPIENFFYSLAKLVLLLVLGLTVVRSPGTLYLSWTLPSLMAVAVVTTLIFTRIAPEPDSASVDDRRLFRRAIRFAATDHLASMLQRSAPFLLPVVVLSTLGATPTSRYFVAWSSAYALYLISSNMCQSLLAEASRRPALTARFVGSTLDHTLAATIAAALVAVVAAPIYLSLFGPGYAEDTTTLFRLLALGAVPNAVTTVYLGVMRVRGRLGRVSLVQSALGIPVLIAAPFVLRAGGLDALGVLWFVNQSLVALTVLALGWWSVWVPSFSSRGMRLAQRAAGLVRALPRHRRSTDDSVLADRNGLRVRRELVDGDRPVIVKEASRPDGVDRLRSEADHLRALRQCSSPDVVPMAPELISITEEGSLTQLRMSAMPGMHVTEFDDQLRNDLIERMAAHHRTNGRMLDIDRGVRNHWIDERIEIVRRAAAEHTPSLEPRLDHLARSLDDELAARSLTVSWIHGDLSTENVLVDASERRISGIIDWELAGADELPEVDVAQLLVALRRSSTDAEIGQVVVEVLELGWEPWERDALAAVGTSEPDGLPWRAVVLLTWLRHVASNLGKSADYAGHRVWFFRNVQPVLAWITPTAEPHPATPAQPEDVEALGTDESGLAVTAESDDDVDVDVDVDTACEDDVPADAVVAPMSSRDPASATDVGPATAQLGRLAASNAPVIVLVVALGLWISSLPGIDLRAMNDIGLLSVLPFGFFTALALLTIGFVITTSFAPRRRVVLGGYLAALVGVVHATPALLYGTVRYSWSWKHLGVVDFIQRNGGVDPDQRFLDIYHGWPGLFGATAFVSDATGIAPHTIALWTPPVLTAVSLLALLVLFDSLVDDRRVVWLAVWIYVLANWVGQEYFSPQGFTFMLYLALLAIALPLERRVDERRQRMIRAGVAPDPSTQWGVGAARLIVVLGVVVIAASHQLTPIMVVVTFAAAAAVRASRTAWIAVTGVAAALIWVSGPAWTYLSDDLVGVTETLGSPAESSAASLVDGSSISGGQSIVVIAGRFLTQAVVVLAGLGVVAWWMRGRRIALLCAAAAGPAVLLATDYGGEVLFRAYMFATPWLALCAAIAITERRSGPPSWYGVAGRTAVLLVMLGSFLLAYLGKERANYFTPDEVAIVEQLYDQAPDSSLLIEGSRNYPGSSLEYEKFFYVPIDREPSSTHARIEADPAGLLSRWLTDDRYAESYLIITRSQKVAELGVPSMPRGLLDRVERALRASPQFEVFLENDDAVVFVAAGGET